MNNFDQTRAEDLCKDASARLDELLDQQIMQIEMTGPPIPNDKQAKVREDLAAAYVDVARSLHAYYAGSGIGKAIELKANAMQKFRAMRANLEAK
jgi:hypothetical protein